jgi:L-ribulose-5-phosphate 4-epimerase
VEIKGLNLLKARVLAANLALVRHGLVILTWGNVSEIDRMNNLVAIKPTGVGYADMTADDIVITDLDGNIIDGKLKPSSDTPTHLELYRQFPNIGGVCHAHSRHATVFAQDGKPLPPYGTTHADYFRGEIPCTRRLTDAEINSDYELNTGKVIAECHPDPLRIPAVFAACHAPFTWGKDAADAVHNAVVLEEIAAMALFMNGQQKEPVSQALLDKHYLRKHGENAYYGQG